MANDVWFTGDWHIGNDDLPPAVRPPDTEELVELYNAVVEPDDVVWMLGNMCRSPLDKSLPWIGKLNGRKYLIAGAWDPIFHAHTRHGTADLLTRYREAGFASVVTGRGIAISGMAVTVPLRTWHGGALRETVQVCHFPPANLASIVAGDPNHRDVRYRPNDRPRKLSKKDVPQSVMLQGYTAPKWTVHAGLRPEHATGRLPFCFNVTPGPHGWLPVHADQILAAIDSHQE